MLLSEHEARATEWLFLSRRFGFWYGNEGECGGWGPVCIYKTPTVLTFLQILKKPTIKDPLALSSIYMQKIPQKILKVLEWVNKAWMEGNSNQGLGGFRSISSGNYIWGNTITPELHFSFPSLWGQHPFNNTKAFQSWSLVGEFLFSLSLSFPY